MYTSKADFHKPEIYGGRVRVWATEWDVFHCKPPRGGRGRRAAVDIFRGVFCLVGFRFLYFERTRPTASTRQPCLMYLSTCTGVRTGCHYLISLSVCVCVKFVVFTDCDSCTRPISTNSGSMEVGEYGLTRGTYFLAYRLELDAVVGRLWISLCVLGGTDFFGFFFRFFFLFERTGPAASMRPSCLIYLSTSKRGHMA